MIQQVYETEPRERPNCGATTRIIGLFDDADIVERNLKRVKRSHESSRYTLPTTGNATGMCQLKNR